MPARVFGTIEQEIHIADGRVKADGDLSIGIEAFPFEVDGKRLRFNGVSSEAVTDDQVSYVYIDHDGDLSIDTEWPSTPHIRLGRVVAANGFIEQIINERVFLTGSMDNDPEYGAEENQSGTPSTVWQEKLRLTTGELEAGTYLMQWYCEVAHSNVSLTEYTEVRVEIQNSLEVGFGMWPLNKWDDWGGFRVFDTAGGVQNIDIDYRVQGGGTAYIRRARIMVWRIA